MITDKLSQCCLKNNVFALNGYKISPLMWILVTQALTETKLHNIFSPDEHLRAILFKHIA